MKKPFKVLSTSALAAALTTSAIVPVAAAEVPVAEATEIKYVVFDTDQGLLTLELMEYVIESADIDRTQLAYVQADNGTHYNLMDYVLNYTGDAKETFAAIEPAELKDVQEGKIVDGKVVGKDEQPEDRLNETLIYNFAA